MDFLAEVGQVFRIGVLDGNQSAWRSAWVVSYRRNGVIK